MTEICPDCGEPSHFKRSGMPPERGGVDAKPTRPFLVAGYDSRADTLKHSQRVAELMMPMIKDLLDRSTRHDHSKTETPEVECFDKFTPKLRELTYDSPEYKQCLVDMKDALDHHYVNNDHHPQFWEGGVNNMPLMAHLEMLADWRAAAERTKDGNLARSLEINKKRFGADDGIYNMWVNTCEYLGWI